MLALKTLRLLWERLSMQEHKHTWQRALWHSSDWYIRQSLAHVELHQNQTDQLRSFTMKQPDELSVLWLLCAAVTLRLLRLLVLELRCDFRRHIPESNDVTNQSKSNHVSFAWESHISFIRLEMTAASLFFRIRAACCVDDLMFVCNHTEPGGLQVSQGREAESH